MFSGETAYDVAEKLGLIDVQNLLKDVACYEPMDKQTPSALKSGSGVVNGTGRVTRSQLRRKQAQQLGPLVGTHHMIVLPQPAGHETLAQEPNEDELVTEANSLVEPSDTASKSHTRKSIRRKFRVPNGHVSNRAQPRRRLVSPSNQQNSIQAEPAENPTTTADDVDSVESSYFEAITEENSMTYSDDEFCADDEDEDDELLVTTEKSATGGSRRSRRSSFSLPDLREGQSSLVGSSNPSSISVHSDGAQCKEVKLLHDSYRKREDLSLPQIANLSQSSSADESSDSYTEPLTPRSKVTSVNYNSLPELSQSTGVPKLAVTNFITPRGVDIVFTTDSESSAPSTFRGFDLKTGKDIGESLPQICSRTLVGNSPRSTQAHTQARTQAGTPLSSLARSKQALNTSRVVREKTGTWLYNKSQKKVELPLVSANYK